MSRTLPLLALCLAFLVARPLCAGEKPARTDLHGDPLPAGAVSGIGTLRLRHPGAFFVAYGPVGKTLVSVSHHLVRVWDTATGAKLREFRLASGDDDSRVICASLSGDGKVLAVGTDSHRAVILWDVATGKELRQLRLPQGSTSTICLAFSPDGKTLAVQGAGPPSVTLWDVATGKSVAVCEQPPKGDEVFFAYGGAHSLAFSPDGKQVWAASETATVCLWQTATGRKVWEVERPNGWPPALAVSADGKVLAWGTGSDGIC